MNAFMKRLLDALAYLVALLFAGWAFWGMGGMVLEEVLEEQAIASSRPVLVEFDVSDRTDGLVVARDGTTGLLYAIKVEK